MMRLPFLSHKTSAVLPALAILASLGFGQAIDGNLVGAVTDSSGAAILAAKVIATNKDTSVEYSAVTDAVGGYRLNNVPVGTYDVTASATRFGGQKSANVAVQLNRTVSVNFTLQVATVETSIQVEDAPAAIDLSTAQLQTTFN